MSAREHRRSGRKCEGCGARVRRDARFCEYCGAELPAHEPEPPAKPSRFGDLESRFRALEEHPSTGRLLARTPSTSGPVKGMIPGVVAGSFFAIFAVIFLSVSISMDRRHEEFRRDFHANFPDGFSGSARELSREPGSDPFSTIFLIVPGLFFCIGVGVAVWSMTRIMKYRNAALRRRPALVVGERTRVSGGGRDHSASTSYHVSLEFEGGRRREYRARGRVLGEVTEGDLGVAYLKDDHLIDFAVVRV